MIKTALNAAGTIFRDATHASLDLFKVMIPITILVKILQELDLIRHVAVPLAPIMELVGLPASMGLVWATGLVVNIYSALIVYVSLAAEAQLTVAQVTVLSTMLLIAHSLPVECKVAQKCGPSLTGQIVIRLVAAFACGILLHAGYAATGTLQDAARIFWSPGEPPATIAAWALGQGQNLLSIFCIILVLMAAMKLLHKLRVIEGINHLLRPVLTRIGIGPEASTLTVVGLTLGLSYGSGLIIHEIRAGRIPRRDIFSSLTLMGLSHALIEDTLLMAMIGAHFSGILWGRLLFSLAFMALLVRVISRMSDATFGRTFMRKTAEAQN
ncbi:hypothetical protein GGQ74_002405 [Desulfobaculum xiamenense]|uniref:Nucleoside recognition n=1 Tax=Desulfobaculum xiamenense TaxID=995050 RepID=A0A846QQF6_9BACT|nr:hypothetical protein [Desulfobaculum xiamenense]NJB68732.1 hypothetical protein [Desulfobaculum xiamenense]